MSYGEVRNNKMIEKNVETIVRQQLDLLDAWYYKTQGNLYSKIGVPDFSAIINSKGYGIETKCGNGHKVNIAQLFQGYKIVQAGGVYVLAYEDFVDFESCQKEFFFLSNNAKHAKNAVELTDEDYNKLEYLYITLNKNKTSTIFLAS